MYNSTSSKHKKKTYILSVAILCLNQSVRISNKYIVEMSKVTYLNTYIHIY